MHVKTVNTYAWSTATKTSRAVIPIIAPIGKIAIGIRNTLPDPISMTANPPKTFNSVWPANMFANNLTDKLIGLIQYEINSITKSNGWSTRGVPDGKNSDKKPNPCRNIPITVTEMKIIIAIKKVIIIWLVKV